MKNEHFELKTICVDFDGVIVSHDTHHHKFEDREPRDGALTFIKKLSDNYNVIIFTTEEVNILYPWFKKYNLLDYIINITRSKPRCDIYLDDKSLYFDGNFDEALEDIKSFKPYWGGD